MDFNISYWGVRDYEGVRFYIEPDTKLNELCPYEKPSRNVPCPHKGLNENTYKNWRKFLYVPGEGFETLKSLIPEGLEIKPELTFIHASFIPSPMRFQKLLSLTNALPLMIYGLTIQHDYSKIFQMVRSSLIRPVYISGSKDIPVPQDFKGG